MDFESSGCAFEPRRGRLHFMDPRQPDDKLIRMLLPRLERISADSYWAHRASGARGALTRLLEQMEKGIAVDPVTVQINVSIGFEILRQAAEEYA